VVSVVFDRVEIAAFMFEVEDRTYSNTPKEVAELELKLGIEPVVTDVPLIDDPAVRDVLEDALVDIPVRTISTA